MEKSNFLPFFLICILFNIPIQSFSQNCLDTLKLSVTFKGRQIVSNGVIISKKVHIYEENANIPKQGYIQKQCGDTTILNFLFASDFKFSYYFKSNVSYSVSINEYKYKFTSLRSIFGYFRFLTDDKKYHVGIRFLDGLHSFNVYKSSE